MSKHLTLKLTLAVSFLLLGSLVVTLDFKALGNIFADIHIGWLIASFVPIIFEISLKSIRLKVVTGAIGSIGIKDSFVVTLIGFVFGAITPGRVGDLVKIHMLSARAKMSYTQSFAIGIIEKIVDVLFLFVLVAAGIATLAVAGTYAAPLFYMLIFMTGAGVVMVALLNKKLVGFIIETLLLKIIPERWRKKFMESFYNFYEVLPSLWRHKKISWVFIFLTFLLWISRMTQVYLFIFALGLDIQFFYFVLLVPLMFVAEILPIAIMGLGVREYTLILLFSLVGISPEASVALGVLIFAFGILPPAILGYIVAVREYGGLKFKV